MKFVCLGYTEPEWLENMPKNERDGMVDDCFDYDDQLRANVAVGLSLPTPQKPCA